MDSFTLRKHQQKTANMLKKKNFLMKMFFQIMLNEVLKSCEK